LKKHSFRLAVYLCVAVLLAGCSGGHRKTLSVAIAGSSATIAPNGTFSLTATVANDTSGDGVTWTLNGGGALSATTTTSTTYTAPATVPASPSVTITATSIADTTVSQSVTFTITQSVSATTCEASPAPRGNEAALDEISVAFLVKGDDSSDNPIAYAGSVNFNPSGTFSAAGLDVVGFETGETGQQTVDLANSSFSYGSDGRGCLYLSFNPVADDGSKRSAGAGKTYRRASRGSSGTILRSSVARHTTTASTRRKVTPAAADAGAVVFSFAILDLNGPGRITEFDNTTGSGTVAAGQMAVQISDDWQVGSLASVFAFGADGWAATEGGLSRVAVAGQFTNNGDGGLINGFADENVNGTVNFGGAGPLTGGAGSISPTVDGTTGRGTGSYTGSSNEDDVTYDFAYYIINDSDAFVISIDDPTVSNFMLSGRWLQAATPGNSVSPSTNYMNSLNGIDTTQVSDTDPGNNYVSIATLNATGTTATGTTYANDMGEFTTTAFAGSFTFDTEVGRFVFTGALSNEIGYVTSTSSEDQIAAFVIGTDGNTGSGYLFTQTTGTPAYTNASLTGNYAFGSAEDVTGVEGSSVGVFSFDGNGNYNATLDEINVGAAYSPDTAITGTYVVNAVGDGSGTFDPTATDPHAFVTNGTLTLAIDAGPTTQPLLYFFLQQPAEGGRATAKPNGKVKANRSGKSLAFTPLATHTPNSVVGFGLAPKK